jgi:lipopolysaccharide transport system ATP-binding protein
MTTVLKIENLWKEYRLGVIGHATLSKDLQRWWALLRGKEDPNTMIPELLKAYGKQIEGDRFWALKGIDLEVKQGEILGIIGKNGAGKSTLLKILSRVTAPTKGNIKVEGRIASLLEVGTGFHPELTGRENIFLNGAILGMSKQEIRAKFDEIVEFSGVADFIDTPVKRYSSGMYVRLAFAVAAHLEPEIMIIDEVLAVGDAAFQKKCLGKMGEIAARGRTVLFVSHQMHSIRNLCTSCVIINKGGVEMRGHDVDRIVGNYLGENDAEKGGMALWENTDDEFNHPNFKPLRFYLADAEGTVLPKTIKRNLEITVNIEFWAEHLDASLMVGYALFLKDECIYVTSIRDKNEPSWFKISRGFNKVASKIPGNFLNEGTYNYKIMAVLHNREWIINHAHDTIMIQLHIKGGVSDSPYWTNKRRGVLAPIIDWEKVEK